MTTGVPRPYACCGSFLRSTPANCGSFLRTSAARFSHAFSSWHCVDSPEASWMDSEKAGDPSALPRLQRAAQGDAETVRSGAVVAALRPEWCHADGQQIRPAEHGLPAPRGFNARHLGEMSQLLEPLFPVIRGPLRVVPGLFEISQCASQSPSAPSGSSLI
jgi:hypothetical protein